MTKESQLFHLLKLLFYLIAQALAQVFSLILILTNL